MTAHVDHVDLLTELGAPYRPWEARAACRGMHPDVFHPPEKSPEHFVEYAKRICQRCPVLQECRDWYLEHERGRPVGVAGGMSPEERKAARKASTPRTDQARCGTEPGCKAHYRRGEKPCAACRDAQSRARQGRARVAS